MKRAVRARTSTQRKRDAHDKIGLGGLVVKAGLRTQDKAVILGALVEAAETLKDQATRERYRRRGQDIFDNDRNRSR